MRPDHALYAVAIISFVLTGIIYLHQTNYKELYMVASTVLGLFFMGLGYTQRPKATSKVKTQTQTEVTTITTTQAAPEEERKHPQETPSVVMRELTEIKGIGAKRAEQLKALGITNIEDLAKSSVEDLASKLKVSQKITKRWIEDAKKLLEKT